MTEGQDYSLGHVASAPPPQQQGTTRLRQALLSHPVLDAHRDGRIESSGVS